MVPEFSVLVFGKSNKCSNGLTIFKSSVTIFIFEIVLNFEKNKDYTGVETQVNSELGHINVTHEFRFVSV